MKNQSPKGGTELQLGFLTKYVDKNLLDQVQICTSVPGKVPIDPNKVNILWQKNSYDQPNLYPWFKNKVNHNIYDWYVFNSHWNHEKFRMMFGLPDHKCIVIKNGIEKIEKAKPYEKGQPIKIIHQNTPWRGLSVLLGAMQLVKNPLITLDVYSSCEVYGKDFMEKNDHNYKGLYEQAKSLPNVNYIGYKPNEYIREHMKDYNMYVYPSIFDYGALFETGAEFPMYIPYDREYKRLAEKFAYGIEAAAKSLHESPIHNHLITQSGYTHLYYGWPKQASSWTRFLQGAINAKK